MNLNIKKLAIITFLLLSLGQTLGITQNTQNPQNPQNPQGIEDNPKMVFLPLAFKAQERGGICVSASALNIIEYLGYEFELSQDEFFKLFNAGRSGASPRELDRGLASIGYKLKNLYHREIAKRHYNSKETREMEDKAIEVIKEYLDKGIPLSASKTGHAMTLIGYNTHPQGGKDGVFYIWDQGKESRESRESKESKESNVHIEQTNNPLKDYGHLAGLYEIGISTFWNKIYRVDVIEKDNQELSQEERVKLSRLNDLSGLNDLNDLNDLSDLPSKHTISTISTNNREDQRDRERFTKKVAPILLASLLKKNRSIIIPKASEILIINGIANNKEDNLSFKAISYNPQRENKETELSTKEVSELIIDNFNTYYSY